VATDAVTIELVVQATGNTKMISDAVVETSVAGATHVRDASVFADVVPHVGHS
jgi:hypothetical protein